MLTLTITILLILFAVPIIAICWLGIGTILAIPVVLLEQTTAAFNHAKERWNSNE